MLENEQTNIYSIIVGNDDLLTNQLLDDYARLTPQDSETLSSVIAQVPKQIPSYDIIKWMELSCAHASREFLAEGQISRGAEFTFKPTSEATLGEKLDIYVGIDKTNRKLMYFSIEAKVGERQIARAKHTRFVYTLSNDTPNQIDP